MFSANGKLFYFSFFLSGLVLVTAEGSARSPPHETGVVHALAPRKERGDIAAAPAPAAEAIVTATSRPLDTSNNTSSRTI